MAVEASEYCDLVMKGGVTSGIVYPNAVLALSERYRFKNIGGTSVGAIAAAATAAAALGDRRKRMAPETMAGEAAAAGFAGLRRAADQLTRRGFIFSLFQPVTGAGAAFRLAVRLSKGPGFAAAAAAAVRAVVTIAPLETLAVLAVLVGAGALIDGRDGALASAIPALLCALAVGAAAALFRVGRVVRRAGFGLCSGLPTARSGSAALTDWLHEVLQSIAGQADGAPLLFEDLWNAPRFPDEPGDKAVDLEMITTGVSHHEPRSLPLRESTFWFRRDEFDRLFPRALVDWMAAQDPAPVRIGDAVYYQLPSDGRMPVLVATRMSLSFPILLSAVPLHEPVWRRRAAVEEEAPPQPAEAPKSMLEAADSLATGGKRPDEAPAEFRICWFSDGGISSNFPIHLFDAPMPRWPTFAIDLVYAAPGEQASTDDVFLPRDNNKGWRRRYHPIGEGKAIGQIIAFLFGIIGTMQNWRDLLQSRAPGHRDRIVRVRLGAHEGGLNLDMPQTALDEIAAKGAQAGQVLVKEFDFDNHWWVRWRTAASSVERFTIAFARGAAATPSPSYQDAHASGWTGQPAPPSYKFSRAQQDEAQTRLAAMVQQGRQWDAATINLTAGAPRPLPQLRITPIF